MKNKTATYAIPVYRLQLKEAGAMDARSLRSAGDIRDQCRELALSDREEMVCLYLDTKNKPICRQTVSIGDLNSTVGHPREIFKTALLCNADRIALVHNHPSGDLTPSRDDDHLTERVATAGQMMGIEVVDHVIVTPNGSYFSYRNSRSSVLAGSGYRVLRSPKHTVAGSPRARRETSWRRKSDG